MISRTQTTTGIVTVVLLTFTLVYRRTSDQQIQPTNSSHQNDLTEYSKELDELRHDLHTLKQRLSHVEQTMGSSTLFSTLLSWLQTICTRMTSLSSSFILYTFFLYLFHLCVFNASTTQTIKLLHIVNIISYSLVTIVYTSFQRIHYSNLAWLLLVLLFFRICIR